MVRRMRRVVRGAQTSDGVAFGDEIGQEAHNDASEKRKWAICNDHVRMWYRIPILLLFFDAYIAAVGTTKP